MTAHPAHEDQLGKQEDGGTAKNERGRDVLTRDGKTFLSQLKSEFSDLDLRLSIMDQQGVDMQVLSPAGSYFFYWMAAAESLEYARWSNDCAAAVWRPPC